MLTSFFGKSKPVNGVAISVFLIIFFIIANFKEWFIDFNLLNFLEKFAVLLCLILSVFTLNFIAKKNELTYRSAYKILFFVVFSASFFTLLRNHQVIFANLLVLLAFRRIISLKTKKVMQRKVFDATFGFVSLRFFIFGLFCFWLWFTPGYYIIFQNPKTG